GPRTSVQRRRPPPTVRVHALECGKADEDQGRDEEPHQQSMDRQGSSGRRLAWASVLLRPRPHAVGTPSSSSSFRSRNAPAGACATPFVWLLLLKNAYASCARPESSRSGGIHSRSSSSP